MDSWAIIWAGKNSLRLLWGFFDICIYFKTLFLVNVHMPARSNAIAGRLRRHKEKKKKNQKIIANWKWLALSFVLALCLESALWSGFGFICIFSIIAKKERENEQARENWIHNTDSRHNAMTQWFQFKIQIIIISRLLIAMIATHSF